MSDKPPPTRMNQQIFKAKRLGAKKGFELLKKKSDALKVRFRDIARQIAETKGTMSTTASSAFFSLTQARYAAGDFTPAILESQLTASMRVTSRTDNVAGVKLPVFSQVDTRSENKESLGLAGGGRAIANCRDKFTEFLESLIRLASLQTSFLTLDEALKVTNRRVNALENVTIPAIESLLAYIGRELDELEREDFTRLKKVKGKKEQSLKNSAKLLEENSKEVDDSILTQFDVAQDPDVMF